MGNNSKESLNGQLTINPDHVQQLPDEELLTLVVRLSFRVPKLYHYDQKLLRAIRSTRFRHVQTKTLVLLCKTAEIEPWFAKAHEQDIARRTQLGPLGYLPIEIRLQIATQLVTPESPKVSWGDFVTTIEKVGPEFFSNRYYHSWPWWNLIPFNAISTERRNCTYRMNEVSHNLAAETQQMFFLNHTIAFNDPTSFQSFLQMDPAYREQSFAFYLRIYEEATDWQQPIGGFPGAWYDALEWMPNNTRSVTFELGRWTKSAEEQLKCLDALNQRVKRFAPGATRRIAPCSEGANVEGRWESWQEVLRDGD